MMYIRIIDFSRSYGLYNDLVCIKPNRIDLLSQSFYQLLKHHFLTEVLPIMVYAKNGLMGFWKSHSTLWTLKLVCQH